MHLSSLREFLPDPIRNQYILGKWFMVRIPHALRYRSAILQQTPIEEQIKCLPSPVRPPIYWTELKNIRLHSSMPYHPAGKLCLGGDWDIELVHPLPSIFEPVTEDTKKWDLHETVRAMFLHGKHYSATPQYASMIQAVERKSPNPPQGCRTVREVDAYFHNLIQAFRSMQSKGYMTQEELGKSSIGEMRLHITRDGRLCLGGGGNHRIRMAEILGVKWVPFLLKGVHPQWVHHLSQSLSLPPHKAITEWLGQNFLTSRPQ